MKPKTKQKCICVDIFSEKKPYNLWQFGKIQPIIFLTYKTKIKVIKNKNKNMKKKNPQKKKKNQLKTPKIHPITKMVNISKNLKKTQKPLFCKKKILCFWKIFFFSKKKSFLFPNIGGHGRFYESGLWQKSI